MRTIPLLAEAYSEARLDLSKLDRDIKAVEKKLAAAAKRMEAKLKLSVNLDTRAAEQKLRNFERDVNRTRARLSARGVNVEVNVDANAARAAEAGRAAREAAETAFGGRPIPVAIDLNDRRFRAALRRVQALLVRLTTRRYRVEVDVDYDERSFQRLQDTIVDANEARRLKVDVEYDVDLESARAEVRAAREELRLLVAEQSTAASTVSINVELDGASAVLSELAAIQTALAALPRQVTVDVDTRRGIDDILTGGGATNTLNELIAALEEAGVSIASFLQSVDALEGIAGRLLPATVREQLVEAARAANATIANETRASINKTQEQLKKVTEKVGPLFRSEGAQEAIARATEVAAATRAVPDEVTVRYRANAADFFDDSFAADATAAAEQAAAAAASAAERVTGEQLRVDRSRAQQAAEEYARLAVDGEKEAQRLRQEAVLAFDDENRQKELNAEAKKLEAKLDQWRRYAAEAKAIAAKLADEVVESDQRLRDRLRSERLENRQLRITTFFENLARTIAEAASINRPLDDIERPRTADIDIDVDTAALDALLSELTARLGELDRDRIEVDFGADADQLIEMIELSQQLLDGVDGRRVVAEFDIDGLLASAAELELILAQLEGLATGQPITAEVEAVLKGLPGVLVGLAELRAAADLSDTTVEVEVDTTSVPGAVARILASFEPVRRLLNGRGQRGGVELVDFSGAAEQAGRFFRTIPVLAEAAFARVRRAGQGSTSLDFTDAADRAQRFYRSLPVLASAAFSRLRSLSVGGQSGFDFDALADDARRYFRSLPIAAAAAAQRVRPLLRRAFDVAGVAAVDIRYKGLPRFLRETAAILAQKALVARDIDIEVDIDRPGRLSRVVGGVARGIGRAVSGIGSVLSNLVGFASKLGPAISESLGGAADRFSDFAANATKQVGAIAGAISSAAGPIGSAIATVVSVIAGPTVIGLLVGAVSALAGPLISALGALIGGAVAFLGSSVIAGLAAGGLPIAAIFLGPAKEEIGKLLEPLKDQLIEAFEPTTNLIVNSILPAFTQLASEIIPIAASVADSFVKPIAESLYALAANPALADAILRLTEPMANGIASIIDTFTKYVPLFTDIALTVGPPITDAVNAILELVFALGAVFQDDIGGAFKVVADLFNEVRPTLASLGPILTPLVGLLAAVIKAFIDAAAGIEAKVGPIGDIIDDIAAAVPQAVPGLIALGEAFAVALKFVPQLIRGFRAFAAVVTGTLAFLSGFGGVVVAVLSPVVEFLGQSIGLAIEGLGRLIGLAASAAEFLGFEGQAEKLRGLAAGLDTAGDSVRGLGGDVRDVAVGLFNTANELGNATDTALGFGDAFGSVADQTAEGAKSLAQLEAEARAGAITLVEFGTAAGLDATSGAVALAGVMDGLTKRIEDGAFALSNFVDEAYELPTAADFVTEVADPRQAARDQRDQARRLRDLQRQTVRDQQDIARAAQDYQDAIAEAAKARQEAPEKYEWGADNFNAVLFADSVKRQEEYDKRIADAERAIQDRSRALEDAQLRREDNQIALSEALEDQVLGDPSGITKRVIDINQAFSDGVAKIAAEAEKGRTLLQIRSLGEDFDPFADFLSALDPEQFQSAIDQLGGVGSQAFNDMAARWNAAVDAGNITFEQAMSRKADLIREETQRIDRLIALSNAGADALVAELAGIESAAEFNDIYEGIEAGIGLEAANAQAAQNQQALDDLSRRAEEEGFRLTKAAIDARNAGVADALAQYGGGVTTKDGKRFGSIDSAVANLGLDSDSAAPGAPGSFPEVEAAIDAARDVYASGVAGFGEDITASIEGSMANLNQQPFFDAGAVAGQSFNIGFGAELVSEGELAAFTGAGGKIGSAIVAGVVADLNADGSSINVALTLLSSTVSTSAVVEQWTAAGDALGRAVMGGIEAGISDSREFLSGRLGAVRLGVTLQVDLWAEAGDALGAAVVAGIAAGLEADWRTVLTALGLYADDVGRQLRPWTTAGEALGQALALGVASGLLANRAVLTQGVTLTLGNPELPRAAVTQGETIGRSMTAGIQRGLLLGLPVMLATATIIADAVAEVMRARLGINSPSRVTETIGGQIVDGLTRGITQGRQRAVTAATVLATDTIAALSALDQRAAVDIGVSAGGIAVGTGVGSALPQRVDAAAQGAIVNRTTNTSAVQERTIVEETTINVYGVQDGVAAANEIARRQRDRKFLRGRQ